MGNVLGFVITFALIGIVGYLGYGVVVDIIEKVKKRNNKKGGKDT